MKLVSLSNTRAPWLLSTSIINDLLGPCACPSKMSLLLSFPFSQHVSRQRPICLWVAQPSSWCLEISTLSVNAVLCCTPADMRCLQPALAVAFLLISKSSSLPFQPPPRVHCLLLGGIPLDFTRRHYWLCFAVFISKSVSSVTVSSLRSILNKWR